MWVPVMLAALAAAPSSPRVALVPVVRPALIDVLSASRVEAEVRRALEKEVAVQTANETSAALKTDPVGCEGNRLCFALIGERAKAWAVVRVEAVEVAGSLTVAVQAIESSTGNELAEDHFTVPAASLAETAATRIGALAAKLKLRVPPPSVDAPIVETDPTLFPKLPPQPPPAVMAAAPRQRRGPVAPILTGAGALAFAGVATGFFVMGLDAHRCLHQTTTSGDPAVCVAPSQVAGKQTQADTGAALGGLATALASGLAITTVVLLLTD